MKECVYYKMLWDHFGFNIEVSVNITRWLIGFGWYRYPIKHVHFNLGPIAISICRNIDE
jgi:hypothetical protein